MSLLVNDPLREETDVWSMQDEAQAQFLPMKYKERDALGADWQAKRKLADKNRLREDGTPNPHHPRLVMEAEMANMRYDMAYVIEQNRRLQEQANILMSLFDRVGMLEGCYGYLRQAFDCVKSQYKDSIRKHFSDRKEWSTYMAMQRAGLNPESKEDRLRWAQKLDALTTKFFPTNLTEEQDDGADDRTES